MWGLQSWNLVHTWTVGGCIMYTRIRLLLLIHPFIIFFFLSPQFSNIKNFHHTFLRNCEAYKVKTWYTTGLFIPLFLHFSLSPNFKNYKFLSLFSGTVHMRPTNNGCMYHVYQILAAAVYLSLYFFIFLSFKIFKHKFLSHFFSGTVSWNLVHMWTMGGCIVYAEIKLLLLICPFFLHISFFLIFRH